MSRPIALRRAAIALLIAVAVLLTIASLRSQWPAARRAVAQLQWAYVCAAAGCTALSLGASMMGWRATLRALRLPVPVPVAARIFFLGQLGKYIPGGFWPVAAQMELGAAAGLSRPLVATAGLLVLAIAVPGALVVGLLAAPSLLSGQSAVYGLVYLALPVALLVLVPSLLTRAVSVASRVLRQPPLATPLTARGIAPVLAWTTTATLLLGLQAWLLVLGVGAHGLRELPLAVGGFALAMVAGLLAVPLPAGAGVREAVLVACLTAALPLPKALVVAVGSRALLTLADLAAAAVSIGRKRTRSTARSEDDRATG